MKIDWKGAVTGVVSALLTTAVLWVVGLARGATLAMAVPSQAVVAFDQSECPAGWERVQATEGRFLIGAGTRQGEEFNVGETGGKEAVSLSVANLPPHSHNVTAYRWYLFNGGNQSAWADDSIGGPQKSVSTSVEGKGESFAIIPPWVAYRVCRKD